MIGTEPTLTTDDLSTIGTPTLVLAGDDDLITLAHTTELYESLAAGQLGVVPGNDVHADPPRRNIRRVIGRRRRTAHSPSSSGGAADAGCMR
jgi:pimeloyl-ACP methyl ester carboxylesterase